MVHICGEDGEGYDCQESYVGECTGSHSVGRPQKRWLDTVKECWKKKEVWMSGKQGEWSRIGVNDRGL